jgi:hypothetical protein
MNTNIKPQNIKSQNIGPQNIKPQNIKPQKIKPQNIKSQNIKSQNNLGIEPSILSIQTIGYAHLIVSVVLIYFILIPIFDRSKMSNKGIDLFKNYYLDNKYQSLIMNFLLAYVYLKTAELLPINIPIIFKRLIVIILFDIGFGFYLNKTSKTSGSIGYLKEWSSTVGWFSILWNLTYISSIGIVADKINKIEFIKKNTVQNIIIGIITFILLHQ